MTTEDQNRSDEVTPQQRAEWDKACSDIRMDAYYYGFHGTGARAVDLILSAVATAGKAYHHTENWGEPADYRNVDGKTYIDVIQDAADAAAAEIRRLSGPVGGTT